MMFCCGRCRTIGFIWKRNSLPCITALTWKESITLYEFDCGRWSGWMYCVNGWYPNYGASRYQVRQGDVIEWHYTCDLGRDLGRDTSGWQE